MHESFSDWYRPLLTQPDDKFLKSRWDLVEATATNLSIQLALELIRLSFSLPNQDDEAIAGLKKQLKSEGISYARATANLELALIGDCTLLRALELSDDKLLWSHVILACALTCQQSIRPKVQRAVQAELFQKARALVDHLAVQWRRNALSSIAGPEAKDLPSISDPPQAIKAEPQSFHLQANYVNQQIIFQIPSLQEINKAVTSVNDIKKYVTALAAQMASLPKTFKQLVENAQKVIVAPQEENDIHWYLLGETSRDLHRRFSSFAVTEVPLVAAKELADLTRTMPGLYAAMAFLDRLLVQGRSAEDTTRPIQIDQAIAAVQPLWRAKGIRLTGFEGTQDLTPVLCALSYATTSDADWRTMTSQLCNVDLSSTMDPLLLSYQLYQEILLSRLAQQQLAAKGSK